MAELPADYVACEKCGGELEKGPYPPHWRHVASGLIVCVPWFALPTTRGHKVRTDAY
jgi:hypothetical protein